MSHLPSKERMPHWTCKTHGDFDARVAVGCPECVRQLRDELQNLRRENVRWENAHKILLTETERLKQKLTDAGVDNLGDNDEYARCRSLDDQQIIREAMETPIRMVHELGNRYDVVCEKLERAAPEPVADEALSLLRAVCQEANEYGGIAEETVQAIELYLQRPAQPPGAESVTITTPIDWDTVRPINVTFRSTDGEQLWPPKDAE